MVKIDVREAAEQFFFFGISRKRKNIFFSVLSVSLW
jgi:hypothetical protein